MARKEFLSAMTAVFMMMCAAVQAGDFTIARRGVPADCTVVLSGDASETVKFAADEFCQYVKRMTGVALPVATDAQPLPERAILLGNTRWTKDLAGDGFDIAALGDEGFRIVVKGQRLLVLGSDVRGVMYGVYEVLERFGGCGWYASDCTVVPAVETFAVPDDLDDTQLPAFTVRTTSWADVRSNPDHAIRLRLNGNIRPAILAERGGMALRFAKGTSMGHTFQTLIPSEKWFASHPEYFCEVDGQRRSGKEIQPCLANPDVLRIVVSNVLECLAADPGANVVGVSQNDNRMYCRCERCTAVDKEEGGPSGSLIRFVNAVAEEVEKVRPDVLVQTLVFQYSRKPPKVTRPRWNVMPCLCAIECGHTVPVAERVSAAEKAFCADLVAWGRISKHLQIWDYSTNYHNFQYPFPVEHTFAPNLRTYRRNGVKYMFMEGSSIYHCDFEALKTWLLAKLMWNPDQDEKTLLDRFFAGYYGAAAPFVREYHERLKSETLAHRDVRLGIFDAKPPAWYTADMAGWAKGLFAKAEAAVKNDPARLANVRDTGLAPIITELDRYAGKAKSFFVSRNPGAHVAPASLRADWRNVLDFMEKEESAGRRMRFAAGLCWHPNKIAEWKRVYGRDTEPEPCDRVTVPASEFFVVSGRHAKRVKDAACAAGEALSLLPSSGSPMARLEFSKVAFDEGVPYDVRFRVKVVRAGDSGAAFRATLAAKGKKHVAVTNLGEAQTLGRGGEMIEKNVNEVGEGYAWYAFRSAVLSSNLVFEIGSGPWDRGGGIGATKEVRLDCVEISRSQVGESVQ